MIHISVIIPTRNRTALVQQAIESVLASCNESLQVEILLIDDGENDQTKLVAQRYPLTYLCGPGRGVSAARNVGLRAATGSYITFLDDDDTWPTNNLMRQIRLLDENPHYGAVCSQVVLTDDTGEICSPPYPSPPFASGWMFNDFLSYIPQVGSLLVRHDIAMAVGDFDPKLQGGEDWDWALRLARICQIGFVAEVALRWRMHSAARFDGAGNRRMEDITWRRYTDVMDVAHRHMKSGPPRSWLAKQRILLKHKGHYIPLFTRYAIGYARRGNLMQAAICYWRAIRISPLHIVSSTAKTAQRQLQSSLSRLRASEQS